jgi:dTDP-4-amino-4,6-dideoxygalactose transaminase
MNSRLDELQAAVLRVKLRHLEAENAQRGRIAQAYRDELLGGRVEPPFVGRDGGHVYHQFVVKCRTRDPLRDALSDAGVGTLIHYPVPVHMQPAYGGRVAVAPGGLPVTETVCGEVLSLPMHPFLPIDSARRIAQRVNQCV